MKTKFVLPSLVLASVCALVVAAVKDENNTIRYRNGGKITLDSTASIADEDGAWILSNSKLKSLASGGGGSQVWTNDGTLIKLSSDANVPPAALVDTNSSKIEINAADASSAAFFYARTRDSGSGFQASTTDSVNGNTFISTAYTYTTGSNGVMAFVQYQGSALFTLLDPAQDNGDAPYVFDTISPATHGTVLADFRLGRTSKVTFGTNGNISASGFLVHSNAMSIIPTLAKGDTYYWSSNGVAYVICSSPNGTLTTNKLGP